MVPGDAPDISTTGSVATKFQKFRDIFKILEIYAL
jgi:hypothetical protein